MITGFFLSTHRNSENNNNNNKMESWEHNKNNITAVILCFVTLKELTQVYSYTPTQVKHSRAADCYVFKWV